MQSIPASARQVLQKERMKKRQHPFKTCINLSHNMFCIPKFNTMYPNMSLGTNFNDRILENEKDAYMLKKSWKPLAASDIF